MKKFVLVLFVVVLSSPAHGMVYTWTDSAGVAHFTNREYEIPARYRAKVKFLYPEQTDTGAPQQTAQTPQAIPDVSVPAPAPTQNVKAESAVQQQAKPEEPAKTTQPIIVPSLQKNPPSPVTRKGRRSRSSSSEQE
jgi:hypothetical protein